MSISTIPVSAVPKDPAPFQPYQCSVCQSRFTRRENLKRHAALHSPPRNEASLICNFCDATFSRPDLRNRHLKRKHADLLERQDGKRQQTETQCSLRPSTRRRYTKLSTGRPQHSHTSPGMQGGFEPNSTIRHTESHIGERQLDCGYQSNHAADTRFAMGPSSSSEEEENWNLTGALTDLEPNVLHGVAFPTSVDDYDSFTCQTKSPRTTSPRTDTEIVRLCSRDSGITMSVGSPGNEDEWFPSSVQIARGCHLFFTHVAHYVPFLHEPTFDATQIARHLLLSMLCLGYQYGDDPLCHNRAGSGVDLSLRCFEQARASITRIEDDTHDSHQNVAMVQACLLLQIYSMMYLCGNSSDYALKTHSKIISLARATGLVQPILSEPAATGDLDSLWREFARAESHKRTFFAVHQIDSLWYQFLSIPRSLSHLEIKHDLPCPDDYWTASSSVDWAHRQLTSGSSSSSVQYSDAVRRFLSPNGDIGSIPAFDPYGAINLTQFLLSSAREVSGWSTMTGVLCTERLSPLKSSLLAVSSFIQSQPKIAESSHTALYEATWETAMLELHLWSPTHTGGIVEGSIDAVLQQMTYLAPSCKFFCDPSTAEMIQPHVDWFLKYLDTSIPELEAPWMSLYAFKAFMIAWQLLRGGMTTAMQAVRVHDGDLESALAWARDVFGRRQKWQFGKIIMTCLDTLSESTIS